MKQNVSSNYYPHHLKILCTKFYQSKECHDLSNEASRTEAYELVLG